MVLMWNLGSGPVVHRHRAHSDRSHSHCHACQRRTATAMRASASANCGSGLDLRTAGFRSRMTEFDLPKQEATSTQSECARRTTDNDRERQTKTDRRRCRPHKQDQETTVTAVHPQAIHNRSNCGNGQRFSSASLQLGLLKRKRMKETHKCFCQNWRFLFP